MNSEALIFLHIPKTAGTTYFKYLRYLTLGKKHFALQPTPQEGIDRFCSLSANERSYVNFLSGHMVFGAHHFMPQGAKYVSVLRDPLGRFISDINYNLVEGIDEIERQTMIDNMNDLTAKGTAPGADNYHVRFLRGSGINFPKYKSFSDDDVDQNCLDQSISNIEKHFLSVGLCENLPLAGLIVSQKLGRYIPFRNKFINPAKRVISASDLDEAAVTAFKERNRYDYALIEYVRKRNVEDTSQLSMLRRINLNFYS